MSAADYTTLSLPIKPPPTLQTVITTYRAIALNLHPDKNLSTDTTAAFQTLQAAYKAILATFASSVEAGQESEAIRSAKPWSGKHGRKFNHRDVKQVHLLRRNKERHEAERELQRVLGEEAGARPNEKRRRAELDREERIAEQNNDRVLAASRHLASKTIAKTMLRDQEAGETDRRVEVVHGLDQRKMVVVATSHTLGNIQNTRPDLVASQSRGMTEYQEENEIEDLERDLEHEEQDLAFEAPAEFEAVGSEAIGLEAFVRAEPRKREEINRQSETKEMEAEKQKGVSEEAARAAKEYTLRYVESGSESGDDGLPERIEQVKLEPKKWSTVEEDEAEEDQTDEDEEGEDRLPDENPTWEEEVGIEFRRKHANIEEDLRLRKLRRNHEKIAALEYQSAVRLLNGV